MSLTLRKENNKPYGRGKYKWKTMYSAYDEKICGGDRSKICASSIFYRHNWVVGKWYTGEDQNTLADGCDYNVGFHVYVDKPKLLTHGEYCVKVEVKGFIASGRAGAHNSETWRKARIVKVFDPDGSDVTHMFASIKKWCKPKKKKGK